MVTARAQVVIPFFSGLPSDVITNTLHFQNLTAAPFTDIADDCTPLIQDFYNDGIYSGTEGIANYCLPANAYINWYNLADPTPRPVYTLPMPITATPAITVIPNEVSCVLSFQGTPLAGVNQARRRGRIYLGGLTNAKIQGSLGTRYPLFEGSLAPAIAAAADALRIAVTGAGHLWVVWSETTGGPVSIFNGWVDNSPDTQRRRGILPTLRTTWP